MNIRGATRREEKKEEGDYYRREIYEGTFSRSLSLPAEVDSGKAKATFIQRRPPGDHRTQVLSIQKAFRQS